MINLLALCLVVSSLVSAGVWSPIPEKYNNKKQEDVIVKEGHRVVVVEYEQQGHHNTKVSISPEHDHHQIPSLEEKISSSASASDMLDNANDKIKKASSVGLSRSKPDHCHAELICDSYGKCKHRIASAIGKAKEKVSEAAEHGAGAKEKVQEAQTKAKETATQKAQDVKECAKESMEKAKQAAAETAQDVKKDVKEDAKETLSKAKSVAQETKDLGKTIGEDVAHNVTKHVGKAHDSLVDMAKQAKQESQHAARSAQISIHQVFDKIDRFFTGLVTYLGLAGAMNPLMGVMNLLGFATAYGMCVWVTFISSYVLAGALPRQQFGMVQSKIYPVYFRAMAGSIGLALLGHTPHLFRSKAEMFQGANLLGSVLMVLANSMYLEPRATKVMFERMKVEKEEGRGREGRVSETNRAAETGTTTTTTDPVVETTTATTTTTTTTTATRLQHYPEQEVVRSKLTRLSERLKKLNTYSSILNILTLMSLSWHLVYIGQRLHVVC
ncbi:hypothetical protein ACOSQ4_009408 [Xanthoceras sorbifolium]